MRRMNAIGYQIGISILAIMVCSLACRSESQVVDSIPPRIICNISDGDVFLVSDHLCIKATAIDNIDSNPTMEILFDGYRYQGQPIVEPGFHTVQIIATDSAGNTTVYTVTFAIRQTPCFTSDAHLLAWEVVSNGSTYFFHGWIALTGPVNLHPAHKMIIPMKTQLCDLDDFGLFIFTKEGEVVQEEVTIQMVCYIPEPTPISSEEVVVIEFSGVSSSNINLYNIETIRIVGDGQVDQDQSFGFCTDILPKIDSVKFAIWQTIRDRCRPRGCRNRPCDPPKPCRWEPDPPRGQTSAFIKEHYYSWCVDPFTGTYEAFWKMNLIAPKSWRPSGWGEAFDRCLGVSISETHTSGIGWTFRVLRHVNPNNPECYPCRRKWASGLFNFGFTCRAERSVFHPLIVAISAVAGCMQVSTSVGDAEAVGGVQVGSSDPIELEMQPKGIKLKLTWRSQVNSDEQNFFVNKVVPDTSIGDVLMVSATCYVWMRLHVDGGSALLGPGKAEAWLKDSYSNSYLNARCERGATGSIYW